MKNALKNGRDIQPAAAACPPRSCLGAISAGRHLAPSIEGLLAAPELEDVNAFCIHGSAPTVEMVLSQEP